MALWARFFRSRQERARLEARARELSLQTFSRFVSSLAHDLKHDMAIIGNYVALIERTTSDRNDVRRGCDEIRRAARAISGRVNGLMLMLNPDSRRKEIISVRSIVSRFAHGLGWTDLSVRLPAEEVFVAIDREQIHTVFEILLANSRQAMANRQVVHSRRAQETIELSARLTDDEVLLLWVDHGCGMSEETRTQCFAPFFTTHRSKTGLGLFAAQRIVEAHGGRITVESREGDGACFTIALPRQVELR